MSENNPSSLKVSDFSFELPDELIARYPQEQRSASRLLQINAESKSIEHKQFTDIIDTLSSGDLLVFNDTRVIPARLLGEKVSGGKVEVVLSALLLSRRILFHPASEQE